MFEFKHVPLHKRFPDFLVSPSDEEFVVMIGLLRQPRGKVDRGLQVHSFPVERNVPGTWQGQIRILALQAEKPK